MSLLTFPMCTHNTFLYGNKTKRLSGYPSYLELWDSIKPSIKCQKFLYDINAFKLMFVLKFYGLVNPMESCWAQSVNVTTLLLGRLSPQRGKPILCTFFARNWQLSFLNQQKGENDRRKYFMINLQERRAQIIRPPGIVNSSPTSTINSNFTVKSSELKYLTKL